MLLKSKKTEFQICFSTTILIFGKKGEKSGWTYIEIPADVANELMPGNKKSFRVKGLLDTYSINGVALLPMGDGNFIMPLNVAMRKGIGKRHGASVSVKLNIDKKKLVINKLLIECLREDPEAFAYFKKLSNSHQNYFSKWIDSAKSDETKTARIARTINAMVKKMNYGEMLRAGKK